MYAKQIKTTIMKLIEFLTKLQDEISDQFNELSDFNGVGEIEIKHGFNTYFYFEFSINNTNLDSYSCSVTNKVGDEFIEDITVSDDTKKALEECFYLLLKERYELLEEKMEADKKEQEKIIPTGDEVAQENGFTDLASSYKQ